MNEGLLIIAIIWVIFSYGCHFNLPVNYVKLKAEKELRQWQQTTGTITSLKRGSGNRGTDVWTSTYEFLDQEGNLIDKKCEFSGGRKVSYKVNDTIMVLFDKNHPTSNRAEMELSEVEFLDRKTKQLKSAQSIKKSFILDLVVVIVSAIAAVIADFTISATKGAAIFYYLFGGAIVVGFGFFTVRKFSGI